MPPLGVSQPREQVQRGDDWVIRRAYRTGKQKYIRDQQTGKLRPPSAAFEPRLKELKPNLERDEEYLSVNILSSLLAAGESREWGFDKARLYAAQLLTQSCHDLALTVTWEPVEDPSKPQDDNPHHGGIWGVVEAFRADRDHYEILITELAAASEVIPECLSYNTEIVSPVTRPSSDT